MQFSRWFRTTVRPLYDSAIADVANFVGSDPKNLVFVQVCWKNYSSNQIIPKVNRLQNAMAAVNTVLKNLVLGPEVSRAGMRMRKLIKLILAGYYPVQFTLILWRYMW